MDFTFNERQTMIRDMVRDFAEKEIRPFVSEWDEKEEFPFELIRKLGDLGLMGILFPEKYGGAGMGYVEYVLVLEELAKVDPSISLTVAAHNSLCTNHIYQFASEELKKEVLPKLCSGEWLGAWGLTEPGSGSDAAGLKTSARRDGDEWIIDGTKNFCTHASIGQAAVVLAVTGDAMKKEISAFYIPMSHDGIRPGKKEKKIGCRASDTSELILQNCRIPDAWRLGEVHEGFKQAMIILDGGRISIAAMGLGLAGGALGVSLDYAKTRTAFGKTISEFQAIQWKLADVGTEVEAARLLTFKAAAEKDASHKTTLISSQAKLFAGELAVKAGLEAIQIFGGYGFSREYPAEKYLRDSKLCTIGEGTSEIQHLVIARELLKQYD